MRARRDFLQMALTAGAITMASGLGRGAELAAQDRFDQDALLDFRAIGTVTLMHIGDLRAQLTPHFLRPAGVSIGVGKARGQAPYLVGEAFRIRYGVGGSTPMDYALTHENFAALAQAYGPMGGLDRVATVVNAIRAERPGALLLAGGDSLVGSLASLRTQGQDMVTVLNALRPDAMGVEGEFAFGAERLRAVVDGLPFPVLAQNIFDTSLHAPAAPFRPHVFFERGGVRIAVIGQGHPFGDALYAAALREGFSFGIRAKHMQRMVEDVRAAGAEVVLVLSQNGFDVDAKMAAEVRGIDVILSGHSHLAVPDPVLVGQTHIIASGGHGRFVSRIDLDVREGKLHRLRHKLIAVFSDLIRSDPVVAALIDTVRAPILDDLTHVVGTAESLLYRQGAVVSTWDDLICEAILSEQGVDIALSPGFRWGPSVLPGQDITREDILAVTAGANPEVVRMELSGAAIKDLLERAADAAFNPDPYLRQGNDMMRAGGLGFRLAVDQPAGARISEMVLLPASAAIDPAQTYRVAGWGPLMEGSSGPPIHEVLERHIARRGRVGGMAPGAVDLDLGD